MSSRFVKGGRCFCCGSSLLRRNQKGDVCCFVCGAGQLLPTKAECTGSEFTDILSILGREPGTVAQILPRVNTPGVSLSSVRYDPDEIEDIKAWIRGFE